MNTLVGDGAVEYSCGATRCGNSDSARYLTRGLVVLLVVIFTLLDALQALGQTVAVSTVVQNDGKDGREIHHFVWNSGGFYEGSSDDGTPLQMNLQFPPPDDLARGDTFVFSSSYWDPIDPEKSRRNLAVHLIARTREFTAESINNATPLDTVNFVGKWSRERGEIQGTWTLGKSEPVHHFELHLKFSYRTEFRSVVTKDAQQYDGRPSTAYATYPLLGDGFEGEIPTLGLSASPPKSSRVIEFSSDAETREELLIVWASGRYIFLRENHWFYGFGAAHGLVDAYFSHYEMKNGKYVRVGLGNFFDIEPRCRQLLGSMLEDVLSSDGASHPEIGTSHLLVEFNHLNDKDTHDDGSIYLVTPTGIEFVFGSDSLGEGAAHDVFVERSKVGRCADRLPQYQ